jgi:micrococcal nuclease
MMPGMNPLFRISLVLVLAIALVATSSCANESYQAKVVSVSDGDTIKVLHQGKQVRIRLYGIDTPERGQAFGRKATKFTANRVAGKIVTVIHMDTDRYGRAVAIVKSPNDPETVNAALVRNGFAWVYRKYCRANFCSDWIDYERNARSKRVGLWLDPNPMPPWEYRRRK